jgi:hypothetical protein
MIAAVYLDEARFARAAMALWAAEFDTCEIASMTRRSEPDVVAVIHASQDAVRRVSEAAE